MKGTGFFVALVVAASAAVGLLSSLSATAQGPTPIPSVWLQPGSPGTEQNGNANFNGTMKAGQFVGGGVGLAGVNADLLDGLNSTAFLQSIPVPLTLWGISPNPIIHARNDSTTFGAMGVYAEAPSIGIYGFASSTDAIATYGVYGASDSPFGRGVYGEAYTNSGNNFGVYGLTLSGTGVLGRASAVTGANTGVFGQSASTSGRGVYGTATADTGTNYGVWGETNSTSGRGVQGTANNTTGTPYGVRGFCSILNTGYAVYAAGDLGGSGTKAFVIDHPFDPENKYLKHYCSEGPEPLNVYSGNVVTDDSGVAWVELPGYFAEINKSFRYTLTVVDNTDSAEFVQAKVALKIRDNRFKVRTSKPNVEVSWEVKGVRNDAWVRAHGAPVEVVKDEAERGKYQHPELYGQPKEMGMDYSPLQSTANRRKS